jgi:hypothetical protein
LTIAVVLSSYFAFPARLFSPNNPHKSRSQALPRLFVAGLFLWRSIEQPVGIAPFMHGAAIFINLAFV